MPFYHSTILIAASSESVWHTLANVVAWPKWLPTVNKVQALDGPQLKVGNRYAVEQPKLRPATWVVTELEPPHRFVWQASSPGLRMIANHVIQEHPANHCQVTLEFSFAGLLGTPIGMLYRSVTESYLAQEAAALKLTVEGRNADNV